MSSSNLNTIFAIQRELIGQLVQGEQAESLVENLLKPRVRSGKEIMAEALTGRIRSDAAQYRQAKRNAEEGGLVADALVKGADGILESLGVMKGIADKMAAPGYLHDEDDKDAFTAAAQNINHIVKESSYNGISFFDGSKWRDDARISQIDPKSGELRIQTGNSYKSITLTDLGAMNATVTGWDYDTLAANPGAVATVQNELDAFTKNVGLQRSGFNALASGFSSIAETLERNATVNDEAASRSILGARDDLLGRLLYAMLREQGGIIDKPS